MSEGDTDADGGSAMPISLRDPLGLVAVLPVLGYLLIPYAAVLTALGWQTYPLVLVGVPQLLLGLTWLATIYRDRARLATAGEWVPSRLWYAVAFALGATVVAAPVVAVVYLGWRRYRTGVPGRGWLRLVASLLFRRGPDTPNTGAETEP
jgi:hypothetical protein